MAVRDRIREFFGGSLIFENSRPDSRLADQVLAEGIKVTDLNPGPVDTDYWGDRPVPREKFLRADDVAEAILYVLAQPEHVLIREINFDNIAYFKK